MHDKELLDELERTYPDTLVGIESVEDLIKAKAHQEVIGFIRLLLENPNKKKGLGNG